MMRVVDIWGRWGVGNEGLVDLKALAVFASALCLGIWDARRFGHVPRCWAGPGGQPPRPNRTVWHVISCVVPARLLLYN